MSVARVSKIGGTYAWSDGTAFTGTVYIGVYKPTPYQTYALADRMPPRILGNMIGIPITAGVPYDGCGVYYNADLVPAACMYSGYFYDPNGKFIAESAKFTVSGGTFTIPATVLPVAAGTLVGPTPDS